MPELAQAVGDPSRALQGLLRRVVAAAGREDRVEPAVGQLGEGSLVLASTSAVAWLGLADSISATSAIAPRARSQPSLAALLVAAAVSISRGAQLLDQATAHLPLGLLARIGHRHLGERRQCRRPQHLVAVDEHRPSPSIGDSAPSSSTTPTIRPPASIERSSAIGSRRRRLRLRNPGLRVLGEAVELAAPRGAGREAPRGQDDRDRAAGLRCGELGHALEPLAVEDGLDHAGAELAHRHSSCAAPAAISSSVCAWRTTSPSSPVRIRIASSTGRTKILPSPISPGAARA